MTTCRKPISNMYDNFWVKKGIYAKQYLITPNTTINGLV